LILAALTKSRFVTIVSYLQPCLETAMQLADIEILKHGHVCTAALPVSAGFMTVTCE
jgi:hypothetical protein